MSASGNLLELESSTGSNPTPWSLSSNRKVGTLTYSNDGDCGGPGITCTFECQDAANGWVSGTGSTNMCGGPNKNTFKIIGFDLFLATSSQSSLNFEASSSSVDVTVRTVVTDGSGFIQSAGTPITIQLANVNEAPTDVSFTPNVMQELTTTGTVVGTFGATDPDVGNTFTYTYSGPLEFTIVGNQLKTTAFPTNFEPPGPAYTFTVQVTDQGNLPTAGQVVSKDFTMVVTDLIEAPSASNAAFAVDENVAAGTFVGNYGTAVTLGDAELTFDIIRPESNSARRTYTFSALVVNTGTGKAIMTLNTPSSPTDEVIQTGDKLSVWGDQSVKTLGTHGNGKKIWVDGDFIKIKIVSTTGWMQGDTVFLDVNGCTDDDTRYKVNGPKEIVSIIDSSVFTVKAYGLGTSIDCSAAGTVALMKHSNGSPAPNGIFTVTSVSGTTIEYSTGVEGKHIGTWTTGTAYVMAFDMEDCSGILTVASDAINYEKVSSGQVFQLEIQVRTISTINTAFVTITVQNIDEAPYFVSLPATRTVNECTGLTCSGTFDMKLDDNPSGYMIDDPEGQNDFTLEVLNDAGNRNGAGVETWEIINTAPRTLRRISSAVLDYESKSTYNLKIIAKDNDDPTNLRVQVDVIVTIVDINEAPTFASTFFNVDEDKPTSFSLTNAVTSNNELSFASAHGLKAGSAVIYTDNSVTTIAALVDGTTYYVLAGTTASKMKLAATSGGTAIIIANGQGAANNKIQGIVNAPAMTVSDPEDAATTLTIMWTETVTATNSNGNVDTMSSSDRPFIWTDGSK
jgi:hypothetical protein